MLFFYFFQRKVCTCMFSLWRGRFQLERSLRPADERGGCWRRPRTTCGCWLVFFFRVMVRNSSISAFNLNSERDEVVRVVAATPVQSALSPVEVDPPPPPQSPQPLKATIRPLPGVVLRWRWLRRVPQTQTDEWFKRIHKALSRIGNERGDVLGMHNCAENCICKRRWWFSGRSRAKWLRAILNRFVEMRLELY